MSHILFLIIAIIASTMCARIWDKFTYRKELSKLFTNLGNCIKNQDYELNKLRQRIKDLRVELDTMKVSLNSIKSKKEKQKNK